MVCNRLPIDSRKGPGRQMYPLENYTVEYSGASLSACAKYESFFPDSLLRLKKLRIVINPWVHQTSIYFATFGPEGPSLGNTVLEHTPVEEATYLATSCKTWNKYHTRQDTSLPHDAEVSKLIKWLECQRTKRFPYNWFSDCSMPRTMTQMSIHLCMMFIASIFIHFQVCQPRWISSLQ